MKFVINVLLAVALLFSPTGFVHFANAEMSERQKENKIKEYEDQISEKKDEGKKPS